jgi:deazaflavin-dependent oxidoreductase (nitroreductase family)
MGAARPVVTDDADPASLPFCYLTTTGRISGRPHRIEIWFALHDGTVYILSGGADRSDWVRNLIASPQVVLEIGDRRGTTRARVVEPGTDEDQLARRLLVEKYQPGYGGDLGTWGRTSLPVAIDWP